uniref:RNA helicase n=1 Tax=Sphenodon punctatus TaxID=8508 RepID=A0A8D0GXJ7_SPHPU
MPQEGGELPPAKRVKLAAAPSPAPRRAMLLVPSGPKRQPPTAPGLSSGETQRRSLPIFQARGALLSQLRSLDSAVLIGETGSGKTTQIPQYLYEGGIGRQGIIAVTQPRRVAAISLATRVSDEKKAELGKLVGYSVRFEDLTSEETRIKFLTDGMLLREAIGDPLLREIQGHPGLHRGGSSTA